VGPLQVSEKVKEAEVVKSESPFARFRAALAAYQEAIKKPLRPSIDTASVADEAEKLINKAQHARK
jgi:hypothetical protein